MATHSSVSQLKRKRSKTSNRFYYFHSAYYVVQLTFLGMCWCVEEREGPLAAGRGLALGASPPGQVGLHVGGTACRTRHVPEYLHKQDGQSSVSTIKETILNNACSTAVKQFMVCGAISLSYHI